MTPFVFTGLFVFYKTLYDVGNRTGFCFVVVGKHTGGFAFVSFLFSFSLFSHVF